MDGGPERGDVGNRHGASSSAPERPASRRHRAEPLSWRSLMPCQIRRPGVGLELAVDVFVVRSCPAPTLGAKPPRRHPITIRNAPTWWSNRFQGGFRRLQGGFRLGVRDTGGHPGRSPVDRPRRNDDTNSHAPRGTEQTSTDHADVGHLSGNPTGPSAVTNPTGLWSVASPSCSSGRDCGGRRPTPSAGPWVPWADRDGPVRPTFA
ncbi:hypothetical protein FB566_4685 [Stackebrandtia endophytica]|uniref:Uncharacterized protein n=1 Tax=Stackebrandtia endophytica TaxID=1496996 RepID=A0A543B2L5_9ACTN|nr:hypothetical protein FB566_4685 [Stackebrandtia endophytica]